MSTLFGAKFPATHFVSTVFAEIVKAYRAFFKGCGFLFSNTTPYTLFNLISFSNHCLHFTGSFIVKTLPIPFLLFTDMLPP